MHEDVREVAGCEPALIGQWLAAGKDSASSARQGRSAARGCRTRNVCDCVDGAAHNKRNEGQHQAARGGEASCVGRHSKPSDPHAGAES